MSPPSRGEPGPPDPPTVRVRRVYDRLAPRYDRAVRFWDRVLFEEARRWVCARAEGTVLEVGIGTGLNLPHYPGGVRITGLDLSPSMLASARARVRRLRLDVDLVVGDAQAMPFADRSFDTVLFGLSLCSIPDDRKALVEARRVLRPGGRLLLLEHVRSPVPLVRLAQRLADPLLVWLQADHLLREPLEHLQELGLGVEEVRRAKLGIVEATSARRP